MSKRILFVALLAIGAVAFTSMPASACVRTTATTVPGHHHKKHHKKHHKTEATPSAAVKL